MSKKLIALLLALVAVFCLAACGNGRAGDKDTEKEKNTSVEDNTATPEEAENSENAVFVIESSVGDLTYPERWKDQIRTEDAEDSVTFYGTVPGKTEQKLFSIEYEQSDGYLLGSLDGVDVYIVNNDNFDFDSSWTDDEKNEVYAMQEDFNSILQTWLDSCNFQLADKED